MTHDKPTDQNAHLQRLIEWCSEAHPNFPPYLAGEIDRAIRDLQSLMPEDIRAIAELGSDPARSLGGRP